MNPDSFQRSGVLFLSLVDLDMHCLFARVMHVPLSSHFPLPE
jgi:hypothetical protein